MTGLMTAFKSKGRIKYARRITPSTTIFSTKPSEIITFSGILKKRKGLFSLFILMLLFSTSGCSAFTTGGIAAASNDTLFYFPGDGTNKSLNVNEYTLGILTSTYVIASVQHNAYDNRIIAVWNRASGSGALSKAYLLDNNLNVISTISPESAVTACQVVANSFYCDSGTRVHLYNSSGNHIVDGAQFAVQTCNEGVGYGHHGLDYDPVSDLFLVGSIDPFEGAYGGAGGCGNVPYTKISYIQRANLSAVTSYVMASIYPGTYAKFKAANIIEATSAANITSLYNFSGSLIVTGSTQPEAPQYTSLMTRLYYTPASGLIRENDTGTIRTFGTIPTTKSYAVNYGGVYIYGFPMSSYREYYAEIPPITTPGSQDYDYYTWFGKGSPSCTIESSLTGSCSFNDATGALIHTCSYVPSTTTINVTSALQPVTTFGIVSYENMTYEPTGSNNQYYSLNGIAMPHVQLKLYADDGNTILVHAQAVINSTGTTIASATNYAGSRSTNLLGTGGLLNYTSLGYIYDGCQYIVPPLQETFLSNLVGCQNIFGIQFGYCETIPAQIAFNPICGTGKLFQYGLTTDINSVVGVKNYACFGNWTATAAVGYNATHVQVFGQKCLNNILQYDMNGDIYEANSTALSDLDIGEAVNGSIMNIYVRRVIGTGTSAKFDDMTFMFNGASSVTKTTPAGCGFSSSHAALNYSCSDGTAVYTGTIIGNSPTDTYIYSHAATANVTIQLVGTSTPTDFYCRGLGQTSETDAYGKCAFTAVPFETTHTIKIINYGTGQTYNYIMSIGDEFNTQQYGTTKCGDYNLLANIGTDAQYGTLRFNVIGTANEPVKNASIKLGSETCTTNTAGTCLMADYLIPQGEIFAVTLTAKGVNYTADIYTDEIFFSGTYYDAFIYLDNIEAISGQTTDNEVAGIIDSIFAIFSYGNIYLFILLLVSGALAKYAGAVIGAGIFALALGYASFSGILPIEFLYLGIVVVALLVGLRGANVLSGGEG